MLLSLQGHSFSANGNLFPYVDYGTNDKKEYLLAHLQVEFGAIWKLNYIKVSITVHYQLIY